MRIANTNNLYKRTITGFTIVELVVVIVLLGIIAAYAMPRFSGRGGYSELTVQQDLKQSIRFAQQLAMSRTDFPTTLSTNATAINVQYNGTNADGYPHNLPSDVTLGSLTLTFSRLGVPNAGMTIPVKGSLNVCVDGVTGYARDC